MIYTNNFNGKRCKNQQSRGLIVLSLSVGSIGVTKADMLDEPNYRSETIVVKSYDDSSKYIDSYYFCLIIRRVYRV